MGALVIDVIQIPTFFWDLYQDIFRISLYLILPVFAVAIIDENVSAITGEANYLKVFIRLGLVLGLLLIYNKFFMTVVEGMQMIADFILPKGEFLDTLKRIFEQVPKAQTWNFFTFAKINIMGALTLTSYVLAFVSFKLFFLARYMFLSLLFVLGPLQIVFGIYKRTSGGLTSWIKSLFQVSAWAIVIALLIRVISVLNHEAVINFDDTNTLILFSLNLFVALLFIFTPFLTTILTSGGSIGGAGSAMIGIATAGSFKLIRDVYRVAERARTLSNISKTNNP